MDSIKFGGAIQAYYYVVQDISGAKQELCKTKHSTCGEKSKQINDTQTVALSAFDIDSNPKPRGIENNFPDPWDMPYGYEDITQ